MMNNTNIERYLALSPSQAYDRIESLIMQEEGVGLTTHEAEELKILREIFQEELHDMQLDYWSYN
jgi:hypothetical protein